MAGSRSNPGQTVTRARGRFGTTSFGSRRRLCPAYLSPAFSFWRVSSYLMTRLSPFLPAHETPKSQASRRNLPTSTAKSRPIQDVGTVQPYRQPIPVPQTECDKQSNGFHGQTPTAKSAQKTSRLVRDSRRNNGPHGRFALRHRQSRRRHRRRMRPGVDDHAPARFHCGLTRKVR